MHSKQNVLDLRPYHVRYQYTPVKRTLALLGLGLVVAVVYTAVFGVVPFMV